MIVTELSPRSLDTIDIDADRDAARAWIAARYGSAEAETVRLNMITSLTGSAVGGDGTSETLTGGADRLILSAIRAAADAVIVGAQTVRAESYLLPRSATLAVVTRSGSLEGCESRTRRASASSSCVPRHGRSRSKPQSLTLPPRSSDCPPMKRHRSRSSTLSETGAFVASCARVDRRWLDSSRSRGSSTSTASLSRPR